MAVVVKNTFLDIEDHTFLGFDDSCSSRRRCTSLPRAWKPAASFPRIHKRSVSISSCSTESDFSDISASRCSSFLSSLDDIDTSCVPCVDIPAFICATPTSPRDLLHIPEPCCYLSHCSCGADTQLNEAECKTDDSNAVLNTATSDNRFDAVVNAVHFALMSRSQAHNVKIERGVQGVSPTLIVAELQKGQRDSSRCYDAVHAARRALEEATACSKSVGLLSKRVQKDERGGYSLRSAIACIPEEAEDRVCWDLFQKGHCPRRHTCHWYHPQESDISRVKVIVRCTEEAISSEDQVFTSCPPVRHTISLGDLL